MKVHQIASMFSPFFDHLSHSNIKDIQVHQPQIICPIEAESDRLLQRLSEVCAAGKIPTNDSRDIINRFVNHTTPKNASDNG